MTGACIATHLADDRIDILTKIRSQGLLKITHADGNFGSMSSMTDGQLRGSVGQRSDRGLVIQGDDGLFQLIACLARQIHRFTRRSPALDNQLRRLIRMGEIEARG